MKRAINFLLGFSMGSLVAATAVLLLTPSSGDELRSQLQERIQAIQQEMQTAAAQRRAELEEQLAALRQTHTL